MSLLPLIVLLLAATCYCAPAPKTFGGGFKIGHSGNSDWMVGGEGEVKRDHLALTADGEGILAGHRKGKLYGEVYGDINGKKFGAEGDVSSNLGGAISPTIHAQGGKDSKGNFPIALKPGVGLRHIAEVGAQGRVNTGDDADKYFDNLFRKSPSSNEGSSRY